MISIKPYIKRSVNFIKQTKHENWRLKVYGISATSKPVSDQLVESTLNHVFSDLPQSIDLESCYGVGFIIIHQGVQRNWILLDWWGHEDILHHKLFSSPLSEPNQITTEESAITACVHELRVINFESKTWIKTVLGKNFNQNFDEYMNTVFEEN